MAHDYNPDNVTNSDGEETLDLLTGQLLLTNFLWINWNCFWQFLHNLSYAS